MAVSRPRKQVHHTEKPAKSEHLPCSGLTGQKGLWYAIKPAGVSPQPCLKTWRWAFCVLRKWSRVLKHKFVVGETVYFTASNVARPAASGTYEVIRLLPTDGDDCQYRIKSSTEAFERVAKESQLVTA